MKKKITLILSIIGVALFINLIRKIGISTILNTVKNISPLFLLILLFLRFIFWIIRTINWKIILLKCSIKLPFWKIFYARISGFTVNYLTPSANIAGEAARVMIINKDTDKNTLSTVILDKTIELIASAFTVMIAIAIAIYMIPMHRVQKYIYVGFILFSIISIIFVLRKQHQGLLKWIIGKLDKLKISFKFINNNLEKIKEIDENISSFYKNNKSSFIVILSLYFLQMLIWTSEIFFTLRFLGMDSITFLNSFLIVSLGTVAFMLPVLPGGIGVYELTYLAIFELLGLNAAFCMALVITRRVIALVWAGIGLIFFAKAGIKKRDLVKKV